MSDHCWCWQNRDSACCLCGDGGVEVTACADEPTATCVHVPTPLDFISRRDLDALLAAGFEVVRREAEIKHYAQAEVGDDAYTWENESHTWGDYVFETSDPVETGMVEFHDQIIRKRWRLMEVTVIEQPAREVGE